MPAGKRRQRIAAYGVCRDRRGPAPPRPGLARPHACRAAGSSPVAACTTARHPTDSLTREIEEESGLTVDLGPLLDVLSDVRTIPDGTSLHTVRLIYRVALDRDPAARGQAARPTPSGGSARRGAGRCRWRTTSKIVVDRLL